MVQRDSDLKNIIPGSVAIQSLALTDGLGIQLCSLTVILRAKGGIALFFNSFCTRLGIYFFLDNDLGLRQYGRSRCRICWCCVLIPNRIQCLQETWKTYLTTYFAFPLTALAARRACFVFLLTILVRKIPTPRLVTLLLRHRVAIQRLFALGGNGKQRNPYRPEYRKTRKRVTSWEALIGPGQSHATEQSLGPFCRLVE